MWTAIGLLLCSNIFMTIAWYGHLKHKSVALWTVVVISWLIAFVEYCFQVPANRIGSNAGLSAAQLKTIQELITLAIFCVFSVAYLHEPIRWNVVVGFALICIGATFVFAPWKSDPMPNSSAAVPSPNNMIHECAGLIPDEIPPAPGDPTDQDQR